MVKPKYEWRKGAPFAKKDAQPVGEELDTLSRDLKLQREALTVEHVKDWARAHTKSALHSLIFHVSKNHAAERYFEDRIQQVLGHLVIPRMRGGGVIVQERVYVTDVAVPQASKGNFFARSTVMSNPKQREGFVEQGWERLLSWCDSFGDLEEFEKIVKFIREERANRTAA